jgi:hypothetical protein
MGAKNTKAKAPAPAPNNPAASNTTAKPPQNNAPVTVVPPPTVLSPDQCTVKKIELNSMNNNLIETQKEVDRCDPDGVKSRKKIELEKANLAWSNKLTDTFKIESQAFLDNVNIANTLYIASVPLVDYRDGLVREQRNMKTRYEKLEQSQRANRRRFLDNSPQEKVSSVLGLHTVDDRIMLVFWVSLFCFIFCITFLGTSIFGKRMGITSASTKLLVDVVIIAVLYGISWFAITRYA